MSRRPARSVPVPSPVPVGVLLAAGLALLIAAAVPVGTAVLGGLGSTLVVATYTWVLAARTGGRPLTFGLLAAALGVVTVVADREWLSTGAAVLTCTVSAVLAVMTTVPAARFVQAARECALATVTAALGALATVGFEPAASLTRFQYTTLVLALVGAFALVFRLGAGFHGLGRRGLLTVLGGGVLLVGTVAYAELLRRYGPGPVMDRLFDVADASREHLGAFPRPVAAVLGVPALAWGCHMRARRRQGWWVCAFGVAATTPIAASLVEPSATLLGAGLQALYSLLVGLVLGYAVIRIDLALTGPRGRRARRAEEDSAVRPEPPRTEALL